MIKLLRRLLGRTDKPLAQTFIVTDRNTLKELRAYVRDKPRKDLG